MISTNKNSRMVAPPNNSKASKVINKVKLVLIDLPIVSDMLRFTTSVKGLFPYKRTFSLILSNTTIVSFTLYPITVNNAIRNIVLTSISNNSPKMANIPTTMTVSCTSAAIAANPYRNGLGTFLKAHHT